MRAARCAAAALAALLAAAASVVRADDASRSARVPLLPTYRQECGACHVAYPPALLPAASWQRLMADLPHHFGVDASLDAASLAEVGAWLQAHAGSARRGADAPPEDRITRSAWFVREHREIGRAVWARPSVKGPSNCAACHGRAEQGVFDEHDVRIPR